MDGHEITAFVPEGATLNCGGAPASTVTVNEHVLELPDASCAMALATLVPTGNAEPVPGITTKLVSPQLSVAVTLKVTTTGQLPVAMTIMFVGQKMVGACVSRTTTSWLQVF